jgi:hypothetical protein
MSLQFNQYQSSFLPLILILLKEKVGEKLAFMC